MLEMIPFILKTSINFVISGSHSRNKTFSQLFSGKLPRFVRLLSVLVALFDGQSMSASSILASEL